MCTHACLQLSIGFRYNRQQEEDSSRYERTNRYTGWFCSEGFKYVELKVLEKENKEEKVSCSFHIRSLALRGRCTCNLPSQSPNIQVRVRYPKSEDLDSAKERAAEKQKELEDADD